MLQASKHILKEGASLCPVTSFAVCAGSPLSGPFIESFDKLSSHSQQALQQLVTQGSKLIPEGSSIRDSYDKLSLSSQQALYHLANSGLSLPSLLPHKHKSEPSDVLTTNGADNKADRAVLAQLTADLQAAQRENQMVADLLQRSQYDLSLSQARTHELLTSVAKIEDDRSSLASQNVYLQATLDKVPAAKECVQQECVQQERIQQELDQQFSTCDDRSDVAESLYGTFGSQVCCNQNLPSDVCFAVTVCCQKHVMHKGCCSCVPPCAVVRLTSMGTCLPDDLPQSHLVLILVLSNSSIFCKKQRQEYPFLVCVPAQLCTTRHVIV